jgi:hypothetical protein
MSSFSFVPSCPITDNQMTPTMLGSAHTLPGRIRTSPVQLDSQETCHFFSLHLAEKIF